MRALLLVLAAAGLHAVETLAVGVTGTVFAPATISANGVAAGGRNLGWSELGLVALGVPPATAISGGVVTSQGEILRGQPGELDKGILRCSSDLAGARQLQLDALAAIILGPLELGALPALLAGEPGAILGNGERVSGKLTFLNAEAVGLDTGRRVAQVPRARIAAVVLRPLQPATASCTWLQLASGDRVIAGGAIAVAPAAVVAAWRDGPGCQQLVQRPSRRAGAIDRQGAALPVRPGAGFPALVGGLAAPTGIRLLARGEIAWDAAGHSQLIAWAACPSGAEATVASVTLDGKVAWEQTLQPGAAAVAVAVPLAGAAEVALRAGPAGDGETGSRQVLWAMPMLTK
jgi:hypothetical protein